MRADAASRDGALEALARRSAGQEPFLAPHHLAAGRRIETLFERARLQPRLTHGWSPEARGNKSRAGAGDLSDMAADARKQLGRLQAMLPRECAGVIIDVCGFGKGLQDVEAERGWPRRSAKLVLRIGLDRLAEHFGFSPQAQGPERGRLEGWHGAGARPNELG